MTKTMHERCRGFTLTELAVVMVIVAIMLGGLLMPLSAQREAQAYRETQTQLEKIREILIGFTLVNGRLPKPAKSVSDGTEKSANCDETALSCSGLVPWVALGITKAEVTDAWGKMIRYSVTPKFANNSFNLGSAGTMRLTSRDKDGSVIYLVGSAGGCDTSTPCTPAAVYSFGKHNWGTSPDGTDFADTSQTNIDEDTNNDAGDVYVARDPNDNASAVGGEFDDLVIWISPYVLFNRMITAGKLP